MTFSLEELKKKMLMRPFGYKKFVLARAKKINDNFYFLSSDHYLEIKDRYGDKTNFLYKIYLFYQTVKNSIIGFYKTGEFITPDKLEKKRNDICASCENLIKESERCSVCGCFVKAKAKIFHSECPIKKW